MLIPFKEAVSSFAFPGIRAPNQSTHSSRHSRWLFICDTVGKNKDIVGCIVYSCLFHHENKKSNVLFASLCCIPICRSVLHEFSVDCWGSLATGLRGCERWTLRAYLTPSQVKISIDFSSTFRECDLKICQGKILQAWILGNVTSWAVPRVFFRQANRDALAILRKQLRHRALK